MKPDKPLLLQVVLITLLLATCIYPQGAPNSRASITSDYRQVTIVAHIKLRKAERIEKIGGYLIYRVTGDVIELFKGQFPADAPLVYYMQIEDGYNMDQYRREKIVFVTLRNNDEATEYRALENSDREPSTKVISILRSLKRSARSSRQASSK